MVIGAGLRHDPRMPVDFSVVIPLFDKRAFVSATLASVLAQSVAPREIIVVDDGSRDGGDRLVEQLGDARIMLIRQANAGPGAARNTGFAAAMGAWVALVDADDLWRRDHLANLAAVVTAYPEVDAAGAASVSFNGDAVPPDPLAANASDMREIEFFAEHHSAVFNASSIAFRRSAFARTAGFGSHAAGEDVEFWIRFALDHRMAVSTTPTALYRRENGGIMDVRQAAMAGRQAAMGGRERVPVSPVFATLDAALRSPVYVARHAAIRDYADRTRLGYARSLLYHGRTQAARTLLSGVGRWSMRRVGLVAMAMLPGAILWRAANAYSAIKRSR